MQRVLEMMLNAIRDTWEVVAPWLSQAASAVPGWAWASLITLALAWAALRLLRPTRVDAGPAPDVLLTRATLTADGPASDTFVVDAAFSNLHHEPVQILRIAAVGAGGRPVVAEVPAIVAARRAVEIETEVVLHPGGRGRLDLYLFVPSSPAKAWRLRVPLAWEPFTRRYQAVLLDQSVRAVRRLPEPEAPMPPPERPSPPQPRPTRSGRAASDPARSDATRAGADRPTTVEEPAPRRDLRPSPDEVNGTPRTVVDAGPVEAPPPAPREPSGPDDAPPAPPRQPRLRFPDRF